jgi:hypothetical protein
MSVRTAGLLAGLLAALAFALAVDASANRISITNKNFRAVWAPFSIINSVGTVRCNLTVEGSFHSATINKTAGALVGFVSRATIVQRNCTGGTIEVRQERLPWHRDYRGFVGTLPNVTGLVFRAVGATLAIAEMGTSCTLQTTTTTPSDDIAMIGGSGAITGLRFDETAEIPTSGELLCQFAGNVRFAGVGVWTLLGNTATVDIRLI